MSTSVSIDPRTVVPIADDEFGGYFLDGCKPRHRFRIGAEFEKFAIDAETGRPIRYDEPGGLRDLLKGLADRFGWEPHFEGEHLTTLSRGGATVSLEPGGQVEFASSAVTTVHDIARQLDNHLQEIAEVAPHIRFVAAGVHPTAPLDAIPLGVRPRHRIMADYLPTRSPTALAMMKATASTQATFDYESEADAVAKFTVSLKFAPIVNALWANSETFAGRPAGCQSARARIWKGMDPDRSGLLLPLLDQGLGFASYTGWLLDVPMLFQFVNGEYRPANGLTFRDYLRWGIEGRHPTLAEWELHLTTVFPEARLKHFLEVRGADANPRDLALAVPAFWKGLFYDPATLAEANDLAATISTADLQAAADDSIMQGLDARLAGRSLRDWNREIVPLAKRGLSAQFPYNESIYLAPLEERLSS